MAQGKAVTPLPQRAVDVLRWMVGFQRRMGYMPTLREIQAAFGMRSNSGPRYYLVMLAARGYLIYGHRMPRTMRVTPDGYKAVA
jgi:SOS-response transcriptional repressor LexA